MTHEHDWYELDPPRWHNLWHIFARYFAYACRDCVMTKVEDCSGAIVGHGWSIPMPWDLQEPKP